MSVHSSVAQRKKSVKFLTVVWGKKYIDRFCLLSLPSFLSPGNIPSLAECTHLEVVIMTREDDINFFKENSSFKLLQGICSVRFIDIDDLITEGFYGVTLTLAYARPIIACGEDMLKTHFVFMNADFVLADGSLRSLVKHIEDEIDIVLGPSYRAIAEDLEPILGNAVEDDVLSIVPRKLVEMSINRPHCTTVAKIYGNDVISSPYPNQLFWIVDENTVYGRYFLSFMLCLKPTRVIDKINCYCDYSLIPELCPNGSELMMGDSDDFFMLELQNKDQERDLLQIGSMNTREIANSLMEWATYEHLRASNYEVIFHSKDIPTSIDFVREESNRVVKEINGFVKNGKSHLDHHYWLAGIIGWKNARKREGKSADPNELAAQPFSISTETFVAVHGVINNFRKAIYRYSPMFSVDLFRNRIKDFVAGLGDDDRVLFVGSPVNSRKYAVGVSIYEFVSEIDVFSLSSDANYDHIVYIPSEVSLEIDKIIYSLINKVKCGGSFNIYADIYENIYSSHFAESYLFDVVNVIGIHSDKIKFYKGDSISSYVSRNPFLLKLWAHSPLFRLFYSPRKIISLIARLFIRQKGISHRNGNHSAYWIRVMPL